LSFAHSIMALYYGIYISVESLKIINNKKDNNILLITIKLIEGDK